MSVVAMKKSNAPLPVSVPAAGAVAAADTPLAATRAWRVRLVEMLVTVARVGLPPLIGFLLFL